MPRKPREEVTPFSAFMSLMTLNGQFDFTQVVNVLSGLSNAKYETDKKFPTPPPTTGIRRPKFRKDEPVTYEQTNPCETFSRSEVSAWRNFLKCVKDCENGTRSACITHLGGNGSVAPPCPEYTSDGTPVPWECLNLAPTGETPRPPIKPEFPCGCPDSPYCGSDRCVEDKCKEITGSEDCDGDSGLKLAAQFRCFDCAECVYQEDSACYDCYLKMKQNCTEGNSFGAPKCSPPRSLPRELWPTEELLDTCFGRAE